MRKRKGHMRGKQDTHRGTILGVRVKSVGEERDKLFACAFVAHRVFTRLRCYILNIFFGILQENVRDKHRIFFNELFYGNHNNRENKSEGLKKKAFLF